MPDVDSGLDGHADTEKEERVLGHAEFEVQPFQLGDRFVTVKIAYISTQAQKPALQNEDR